MPAHQRLGLEPDLLGFLSGVVERLSGDAPNLVLRRCRRLDEVSSFCQGSLTCFMNEGGGRGPQFFGRLDCGFG